jgi:hypothetical protein
MFAKRKFCREQKEWKRLNEKIGFPSSFLREENLSQILFLLHTI